VYEFSSSGKRRQRAPVYLSLGAFAEAVDVSRVTVWRWRKTGYLRTVKLSPTITRVHVSEIDRLAQQSEHEPPPPPRKRRKRLGAGQQNDDPRDDDPQDDPPEEPD
jgi:hypothetical protein